MDKSEIFKLLWSLLLFTKDGTLDGTDGESLRLAIDTIIDPIVVDIKVLLGAIDYQAEQIKTLHAEIAKVNQKLIDYSNGIDPH